MPTQGWRRLKPQKSDPAYRQLWRVVDGAVADAFAMHPEYLTTPGFKYARNSVVKRVVGNIMGYAGQVSAQGRSGSVQRLNSDGEDR